MAELDDLAARVAELEDKVEAMGLAYRHLDLDIEEVKLQGKATNRLVKAVHETQQEHDGKLTRIEDRTARLEPLMQRIVELLNERRGQ